MITVERVSKSFANGTGRVVALDDVTLDVPAGTVSGVVGSTSSGKSTLARCVALRERPDSGVIRFDGVDTTTLDARGLRVARLRIGVVGGGHPLVRQRTVAGNIALPLEQTGVDGPHRRRKVGQLLDVAGLATSAGLRPDDLSEEQRRRVAIARALVGEPTVLLADDPTASLPAEAHSGVLAVLDRARAELGATVLLTTSDPSVARRICDDVTILDHGRVIGSGTLLDMVSDPGSAAARLLLPPVDGGAAGPRPDVIADLVLLGFAAVGALLPEAGTRFGVRVEVLGGGLTRFGETPVAQFRVGLFGDRAEAALAWIADRGGVVRQVPCGLRGVAA